MAGRADQKLSGSAGGGHRRRSMEPGSDGVQTERSAVDWLAVSQPHVSTVMRPPAVAARAGRRKLRRAAVDLALGLVPLSAAAAATWWLLGLPILYFADVAGLYALMAALIVRALPEDLPAPGIGAANRITLFRATLLLPICALAIGAATPNDTARWWIVGVGTVAMVLDGVDGYVARRSGGPTQFGGRFDMELDSFLLLGLSVLVWWSGQVGAWVMSIGLARYLFVAAAWIWPSLAADLPGSFRRKAICVVQGVVLLTCLGPIIPASVAVTAAAAALALLIWSFGVDILWLRRAAARTAIVVVLAVAGGCGDAPADALPSMTVAELTARAEEGDNDTLFELGWRYHAADGVGRDTISAFMWFVLAAEFDTTDERYQAERMQLVLDPDMFRHEIAEARRLAAIWKAEHRPAPR